MITLDNTLDDVNRGKKNTLFELITELKRHPPLVDHIILNAKSSLKLPLFKAQRKKITIHTSTDVFKKL